MILGILSSIAGFILPMIQKRQDVRIAKIEAETGVSIEEIRANKEILVEGASVIKTGMGFKLFWIPWMIAAVPASCWYAWGMIDSLVYAGQVLPDVAALPPQLASYTDAVWNSLFYSGAVVGGAQAASSALVRTVSMISRRRR